jgi:trigger factor
LKEENKIMSVQVERLENSTVKLTIEVPETELEKALQDAYNKQKKSISIPGFRKGKVPRAIVEKMYGPAIFYNDAADALLPPAYSEAAKECGEDIMSRPTIDIVQIEKGKPFIFTAEVAVRPEVKLGDYKGIEVTKVDTSVSDEEVEEAIERERERNGRDVTVEDRAIEDGDTAVIDYEGFVDGVAFDGGSAKNQPLKIGSGTFIPGFEEQLIGKNAGDDTEVNVTFPEDYHADDLAGKDATFKVTIHEIKTRELPELDDEFAQDVSEYETFEEYKNSVKERLEKTKADSAKSAQMNEALDQVAAAAEISIPDAILETRADDMINQFAQQLAQQGLSMDQYMQYSGQTQAQLRESVLPDAETRVRSELVLDEIAKLENIEITEADIQEEIEKMAEMYNIEVDKLKEFIVGDEEENMKLELASRKAMDLIYDNAVFVEAEEEKAMAAIEEAMEEVADAQEEAAE